MLYTIETKNSYGWLHPQNRSDGLIPRFGLLTSEIATIVGEDALSIRERIRAGSIPGVRLHDAFKLVVAYAMTFSDIADHFALTPNQKFQLGTYPLVGMVPSADKGYKHRLTFSPHEMSGVPIKDVPIRTEFSTLDELKAENPQSFITHADASHWLD